MLIDTMKERLRAAMKARRTVEKEILRVAIGEVQTVEARGTALDDAAVEAIVRKLIKSDRETLEASSDAEQRRVLEEEIAILQTLLPQQLDAAGIEAALGGLRDALRAAASDGQATGVAMKHLKSLGTTVDGRLVQQVVAALRR